jgi:tryptophanyl-tRNA synthetase
LFTDSPLILGSDNRKMSKSYGNHIPLEATEKETEKILKKYYTDPAKVYKGDPGNPDICPIYLLHRIYTPGAAEKIAPPCRTGELGCVDCKKMLTKNLNEALQPIRDRRTELLKRPDYIWEVLETGRNRAQQRAQNVMDKVRSAMKMNYRKKK